MTELDRAFLERLGTIIAQLKMLAILNKRTDLVAEVEYWEHRREALLERIDSEATCHIVTLSSKKANGEMNVVRQRCAPTIRRGLD